MTTTEAERTAFEAWATQQAKFHPSDLARWYETIPAAGTTKGRYCKPRVDDFFEGWLAAKADAAKAGEGYVLVPREPTEAMKEAGANIHTREEMCATEYGYNADRDAMSSIWRAMVSAALKGEG